MKPIDSGKIIEGEIDFHLTRRERENVDLVMALCTVVAAVTIVVVCSEPFREWISRLF